MLGVSPVAVKLRLDCQPLFAVLHFMSPAIQRKLYWTALVSSIAVVAVMLMMLSELAAGVLAQVIGSGVGAVSSSDAVGTEPLIKY